MTKEKGKGRIRMMENRGFKRTEQKIEKERSWNKEEDGEQEANWEKEEKGRRRKEAGT